MDDGNVSKQGLAFVQLGVGWAKSAESTIKIP